MAPCAPTGAAEAEASALCSRSRRRAGQDRETIERFTQSQSTHRRDAAVAPARPVCSLRVSGLPPFRHHIVTRLHASERRITHTANRCMRVTAPGYVAYVPIVQRGARSYKRLGITPFLARPLVFNSASPSPSAEIGVRQRAFRETTLPVRISLPHRRDGSVRLAAARSCSAQSD